MLGPVKLLVQKFWASQKDLALKTILSLKKFWSKEVWSKNILVQKIMTPKKLGPKSLAKIGLVTAEILLIWTNICCLDKCHHDS